MLRIVTTGPAAWFLAVWRVRSPAPKVGNSYHEVGGPGNTERVRGPASGRRPAGGQDALTITGMPPRHHEVTRLEGFSDAVFGFALTLLVVSLEVPNSVGELVADMKGLLGFALMFAMVCWIWYEHNIFFRSYGLQDQWTVFLNCVLLFVVLFYVYPLKFLTAALMREFFGIGSENGPRIGSFAEGSKLMLLYSTGVVLIFAVFTLLYRHAWNRRAALALTAKEELSLRFGQRGHLISMGLGLASLAIVLTTGQSGVAGIIYVLMGPLHAWNGYRAGKAHHQLEMQTTNS